MRQRASLYASLCLCISLCASGCVERRPAPWDEELRAWDAPSPPDALPLDALPPDALPPDALPPDAPPPDELVFRRRYAIELTWSVRAPEGRDPVADLDLHLAHPQLPALDRYNFSGHFHDCSYLNTTPDWGEAGDLHNPSLDRDELQGSGAEVITLDDMEAQLARGAGAGYTAAVVVYALEPLLSVEARVRVFVDGALVAERTRVLGAAGEVWIAGRLGLTATDAPEFTWVDQARPVAPPP